MNPENTAPQVVETKRAAALSLADTVRRVRIRQDGDLIEGVMDTLEPEWDRVNLMIAGDEMWAIESVTLRVGKAKVTLSPHDEVEFLD